MEEKKYYVYGHYLEDGTLFYIGKGCDKRYKSRFQRPKSWKAYAKDKVWYSEILIGNLSNNEALDKEFELIEKLKDQLVNSKTGNLKVNTESILKYVEYDPTSSTGIRWKVNRYSGRKYSHISARAGDEAGGSSTSNGYTNVVCKIDKVLYVVSRVVWFLVYGVYPDKSLVIDHLNGDSLDNRVENLKLCSQHDNTKNKKIRTDNVSGKTGIYFSVAGHYNYCQAAWSDNGKIKVKTYSINKHGLLPAFKLAYEWRKEQIRLLNLQGAGYTDRHGT